MEWDILILMLERRNLVAHQGTASIKFMNFDGLLPYKLLYSITRLLNGKFAERPPLEEFSIEAIGSQLWNPQISGCRRCICSFRVCDHPVRTLSDPDGLGDDRNRNLGLLWSYPTPSEHTAPNPPLSAYLTEWVKEKRTRRLKFMEMSKAARRRVLRSVVWGSEITGRYIVNRYSMDGAYFAE